MAYSWPYLTSRWTGGRVGRLRGLVGVVLREVRVGGETGIVVVEILKGADSF